MKVKDLNFHFDLGWEFYIFGMDIRITKYYFLLLAISDVQVVFRLKFLQQSIFVEFWGLPPSILFFITSTGWFGRFVLSTECYRTRKLGYNNLNGPRCSARVTESLALTDGSFCQSKMLYILDYVKFVSL